MTKVVSAVTGEVAADRLATTLMHEHLFVRSPDLDRALPDPEWDEQTAVDRAVAGLERLHALGVRTLVDLTVPGLGRDIALVRRVAERSPVQIVVATGYYSDAALPPALRLRRPGLLVDGSDPLLDLFIGDIEHGIEGTGVRAGIIKITSDVAGITPDLERVFRAAAIAHQQTGVPITTHSYAASGGGREQQRMLTSLGVAPDRIVIGHSCDTTDLDYLRDLADNGSVLGFDRFGMEHIHPDELRIHTLLALLDAGYADRVVLSHDAAFYSRVTPPSWRAAHTPNWHMEHLFTAVIPRLRAEGVDDGMLELMLVDTPRRLLTGA
jgi:phosphotriesterase-related protein